MSLKTSLAVAATTAIGLTAFAHPAQAALFNFSYTSSVGVITGMLEGTVQGDNDTVVVSGITMTAFDGTPTTPIAEFAAYSPFSSGTPTDPVVSLSGSVMDLIACSDSLADISCDSGFGFAPAGILAPTAFFTSNGEFGNIGGGEQYDPANWTLTAKAVPEPSSIMALLGLGLGLMASKGKKQA